MKNTFRAGYRIRTYVSTLETSHVATTLNPQLHNYIQHTTLPKCENTNSRGITRIVLNLPDRYGSMFLDLGKESNYDCCGRIAYSRRRGPYPSDLRVHCQRNVQERRDKVQEDRQELESQARGPARVHRQGTETRSGQIKNAGVNRLGTTKNFLVAIRSTLKRSGKLTRDGPRNSLPVFSIAKIANPCQWLHKTDSDRRESVLCTVFSPVALFPVYVGSEDGHARYYY